MVKHKSKNKLPPLLLFVDPIAGLGHIMRCVGLAEAWKLAGGKVKFGHEPTLQNSVVVFDGYLYTNTERRMYADDGHLVVSFSDYAETLDGDVVINYNLGASTLEYEGSHWLRLLEPLYFPMCEFIKSVKVNQKGEVFDATQLDKPLSHKAFIKRMAAADFVICSASVKAYEALYLNKRIMLRYLADNQALTFANLNAGGWTLDSKLDGHRIGRNLVDGNGGRRLVDGLLWAWKAKFSLP